MPTIARLIGGAGTGKTAELMRYMAGVLEHNVDPLQIGFCSFTRAARREAAARAADMVGCAVEQLEDDGWFRTLHSVCFKALGLSRGNIIAGDRKSSKWITDAIGEDVGIGLGDNLDEEGGDFEAHTDAGVSLAIWKAARSRLEPLRAAWERADRCSNRTPAYEAVESIVERYEQAKRLDGACDFEDIAARFGGWQFGVNGHEQCQPEGDSPYLHVWFFDEQQDTSALLDCVCKRLIETATWVYVVGDPFQSIYAWAGADHSLFRKWEVSKERVMPKSYRCPKPIHELGEQILSECSDYWDRGILPADHEGAIDVERYSPTLLSEVTADASWLVLARTNWLANKMASRLTEMGVPWKSTRGPGGWPRKSRFDALFALAKLAGGLKITAAEWLGVIKAIPSKCGKEILLKHGAKSDWEANWQKRKTETYTRADLDSMGAGGGLVDRLSNAGGHSRVVSLIEGGEDIYAAWKRWGEEKLKSPGVNVGTIHSAKGAEADNVLWLTTTSDAVAKSCQDQEGFDEESRVAYVAATRARQRLVVAIEPNRKHRFRGPW